MRPRLATAARWAAYPALYLFCLALFGYLTFPYDRLKDRLIFEFEQTQKGPRAGQRLEIGRLSSYWFSGAEAHDIKLIFPPDPAARTSAGGFGGFGAPAAKEPEKEKVISIPELHVRVRLWPLLIGRVKIDFGASVFGGEVSGVIPVGTSSGHVEVELADLDLGKVDLLVDAVGIPIRGSATGRLELFPNEGKFSKSNGSFDLTVSNVSAGDGKTKLKGTIALPEAKLGDLIISAEAKDGILKITKLTANGVDIELVGDGKVTVREPWDSSVLDLYIKFKFTDAYRGKDETTRVLLGAPGSTAPGLFDMADPKIKRAKRPDGFYGFHIYGPLKRLKFDPSVTDGPAGGAGAGRARGKPSESPFAPSSKRGLGGISSPLGGSDAENGDKPLSAPPAAAPPPPAPMALPPPPAQPATEPEARPLEPPPAPPPPAREPPPMREEPQPSPPPAELVPSPEAPAPE